MTWKIAVEQFTNIIDRYNKVTKDELEHYFMTSIIANGGRKMMDILFMIHDITDIPFTALDDLRVVEVPFCIVGIELGDISREHFCAFCPWREIICRLYGRSTGGLDYACYKTLKPDFIPTNARIITNLPDGYWYTHRLTSTCEKPGGLLFKDVVAINTNRISQPKEFHDRYFPHCPRYGSNELLIDLRLRAKLMGIILEAAEAKTENNQ